MSLFCMQDLQIVYNPASPNAEVEHEVCYWLRQLLEKECNVPLSVSTEEREPSKPAILLGALASLPCAPDEYAIGMPDANTLVANAGSMAAYDDLIKALLNLARERENPPSEPVRKRTADRSIGTRHGDLRVLYHNMFGYDRKPTINPQRRFAFEAILYREYDADILCLQEYDGGPRKKLAPLLEERGYEEVPVDLLGFAKNCSPILFDRTRVTLIDHGFYPFTYKSPVDERVCNNHDTKNLTWAVFEQNESNKRFVVISVHYYYSPDASSDMTNRIESNLARMENAKELYDVITRQIRVKNDGAYKDLPILLGGDLNCSFANRELPSIKEAYGGRIALDVMAELGMKHLQESSKVFADDIGAYCGYPSYDEELGYYNRCGDLSNTTFSRSIDHVYTYGQGLCGMTFDVLDGSFAKKTSDHCPILVDLVLE